MTQPQPPYVPGHQQPIGFPPAPPKKKSKLPWILGGIGAFLALCLGGVVLIGVTADSDKTGTPEATSSPAVQAAAAIEITNPIDLARAMEERTGLKCTALVPVADPVGANARSSCTTPVGEVIISTYDSSAQAQAAWPAYSAMITQIGPAEMTTGDTWTVSGDNSAYIKKAAEVLGGSYQSAPKAADPPKPPPAAKPTIEDGVWTVGEDIPAGTYKVTEKISGMCYWAITKSGTNGSDIIDNDIPSGGLPRVTIKKGQDFETNGCGTWKKQ
jgi:hypothetical protein